MVICTPSKFLFCKLHKLFSFFYVTKKGCHLRPWLWDVSRCLCECSQKMLGFYGSAEVVSFVCQKTREQWVSIPVPRSVGSVFMLSNTYHGATRSEINYRAWGSGTTGERTVRRLFAKNHLGFCDIKHKLQGCCAAVCENVKLGTTRVHIPWSQWRAPSIDIHNFQIPGNHGKVKIFGNTYTYRTVTTAVPGSQFLYPET